MTRLILPLTLCLGLMTPGYGQETAAHIPGAIPDGTPPPPAAPKPVWSVDAADVLKSWEHQQGGRSVTIREIRPIDLPPRPVPEPSAEIDDAAWQRQIEEFRAAHPRRELLSLGATVYRTADSPPRTEVRVWGNGPGDPVSFWSSGDFTLLAGVGSYVASDGHPRALMMMCSEIDLDLLATFAAKSGRPHTPPEIPYLADGPPTFAITSGQPDKDLLIAIRSLHEILASDHERLHAAREGRLRAARERAAHLLANPPQAKDIIVNHWRIQPGVEGGAE